jgi:hypothetical protein
VSCKGPTVLLGVLDNVRSGGLGCDSSLPVPDLLMKMKTTMGFVGVSVLVAIPREEAMREVVQSVLYM